MTSALRDTFVRLARVVLKLRPSLRSIGRLGLGRQGGLAATRRRFPARAISPARMMAFLVTGSTFIGIGVVLLTEARLGLSPYDVLVSGLQPRLGISFGLTVMFVSAALFLIAAILGQRPSRWGVAYVVGNGLAIDAISGLIHSPESMVGRILFVAIAVLSLSAGISVVVHSGSTGGAFELLMRAGELRNCDRRVVRTSLEVGILVLGIMLGGSFGPATVAVALGIGPLLGVIGQALEDHSHGRATRLIVASPESRHPSAMARNAH